MSDMINDKTRMEIQVVMLSAILQANPRLTLTKALPEVFAAYQILRDGKMPPTPAK